MLTDEYRRSKLVVLAPHASVVEAARAMDVRGVGAVLVADHRHLVGIVTDRDLAADVVARGEDPLDVQVADIMHAVTCTVAADATLDDVLAAMREHACRRVPIVDGDRLLGIVTLDDLIMDGWIDANDAAAVLRAQLPERPRFGFGERALVRGAARAEHKLRRLVTLVARDTALGPERAELALKIVIGNLCRRILPTEAAQLLAQLPSRLRDGVAGRLDGPDRSVTRRMIEDELVLALGIDVDHASTVLETIAAELVARVSSGEMAQVVRQLPRDLAELFRVPGEWMD